MTVSDWAIVGAALFWAVLVVVLCVLVLRAVKLLDSVIGTVGRVTDETVPILRGVNETVAGVNVELARVDTIMAGVQSITATTDRVLGVVHATLASPLIKAAAVAAGTARAARSLRD
ncbi:DUF948 domain-containing protein [Egicoccus halophilus]|uniref:DUF948 domain-containing protein n=1 Tax=Egicoccus halophilus TaxID=1670830 RepID=A0A8J3EY79_9ACTN|nr:DUF948 domain-containing protein [Egicoccus halophilus]GGI07335.1 hypothetical protein GCM10011354_23570 [Egicoccus halophilus]